MVCASILSSVQNNRHLGCEHAVRTLQNSKFLEKVRVPIHWKEVVEETTSGRHFEALAGVTQTCKQLAAHTRKAVENKEELLVIGGDHSCAMGTWSGVASAIRPCGELGLIWVDAHMNLTSLGDTLSKVLPHNMCMVGIRSYEKGEQELLERLGVRIFYMEEVDRRGIADVMQEAQYLVTRLEHIWIRNVY
ncbi:unnamed protein product [Strongylus vulgaris]|uniref:Arginase n=1 Tax=Strongylus vulgaris TaxID=40348 RepID=A0A3P7J2H1_STRVU|nr:unnamed protein product [Strongylus vulgaris]